MDITILGTILTTIGTVLTIWSLLYARSQAKKMSDLKRNQNITLWAALARIGRAISDVSRITDDDNFINTGTLSEHQRNTLPKLHRTLADQYVRLAEIIVQSDKSITTEDIEKWHEEKRPGVETPWRKKQFDNLLQAGNSTIGSNK